MAQTPREYLASLTPPLAIPGARGRFSREAQAELARARAAGIVFAEKAPASAPAKLDDDMFPIDEPRIYEPVKSKPIVRKIDSVTGYTAEDIKVVSDVCMRCCYTVSRCDCTAGIYPSRMVVRWDKNSVKYGVDLTARV